MRLATIFLFVILFSVGKISAQSKILDTIPYKDVQIIISDDYTWKFVNRDSVQTQDIVTDAAEKHQYILKNKVYDPDSVEVFGVSWDSIELFPYGGMNYAVCQDTLVIPLEKDPFTFPILGRIFGEFTYRGSRFHNGVDIDLKTGDPIRASFSGKVRKSYYNPGGYGYMIIIRHFNGLETYYAHLSKLLVPEGQWVNTGDTIGLGGATGRATAPHLHWEVRYKDNSFNPRLIADFENGKTVCDTLILKPSDFKHVKDLSEAKYHYIVQGDTLWGLSRKYGVAVAQLCRLNNISETSTLRLGTALRVR